MRPPRPFAPLPPQPRRPDFNIALTCCPLSAPRLSSVSKKGEFVRKESVFRDWIRDDPEAKFAAEPGRYVIYISHACPWAHRTVVTRALKGLEEVIDVAVVDWFLGEGGWKFTSPEECPGSTVDHVNGKKWMREICALLRPGWIGARSSPYPPRSQTRTPTRTTPATSPCPACGAWRAARVAMRPG